MPLSLVLTLRNIFRYSLHTIFLFYAVYRFSNQSLSNIEIVGHSRAHQIVPTVNTAQNYHKTLTISLRCCLPVNTDVVQTLKQSMNSYNLYQPGDDLYEK